MEFIENRRTLFGLIIGIIIILSIGVAQINFLQNRVSELESTSSEMEQIIEARDGTIQEMSNQITDMEDTIEELDSSLVLSQENNTKMHTQLKIVNATLLELEDEINLLDEAIYLIGQGDIETLLLEYGETLAKYNDLKDEYDILLRDYNRLLDQLGN